MTMEPPNPPTVTAHEINSQEYSPKLSTQNNYQTINKEEGHISYDHQSQQEYSPVSDTDPAARENQSHQEKQSSVAIAQSAHSLNRAGLSTQSNESLHHEASGAVDQSGVQYMGTGFVPPEQSFLQRTDMDHLGQALRIMNIPSPAVGKFESPHQSLEPLHQELYSLHSHPQASGQPIKHTLGDKLRPLLSSENSASEANQTNSIAESNARLQMYQDYSEFVRNKLMLHYSRSLQAATDVPQSGNLTWGQNAPQDLAGPHTIAEEQKSSPPPEQAPYTVHAVIDTTDRSKQYLQPDSYSGASVPVSGAVQGQDLSLKQAERALYEYAYPQPDCGQQNIPQYPKSDHVDAHGAHGIGYSDVSHNVPQPTDLSTSAMPSGEGKISRNNEAENRAQHDWSNHQEYNRTGYEPTAPNHPVHVQETIANVGAIASEMHQGQEIESNMSNDNTGKLYDENHAPPEASQTSATDIPQENEQFHEDSMLNKTATSNMSKEEWDESSSSDTSDKETAEWAAESQDPEENANKAPLVVVGLDEARLGLMRVIVYLEDHPDLAEEFFPVLWKLMRHLGDLYNSEAQPEAVESESMIKQEDLGNAAMEERLRQMILSGVMAETTHIGEVTLHTQVGDACGLSLKRGRGRPRGAAKRKSPRVRSLKQPIKYIDSDTEDFNDVNDGCVDDGDLGQDEDYKPTKLLSKIKKKKVPTATLR